MRKTYWAFVAGSPAWDRCECNIPLVRAEGKRGRGRALIQFRNGKDASTLFEVKEQFGDITLLEAHPYTGRLHQIRVHSNALGHAILGDKAYGKEDWQSQDHPEWKPTRVMLHARTISFTHPISNKEFSIESPLSEDMRFLYNLLLKKKKNAN